MTAIPLENTDVLALFEFIDIAETSLE